MSHSPNLEGGFTVGDQVQFRSDRSKVGEIVRVTPAQGEQWYGIRLLTGRTETAPGSDLEPFQAAQDPEGLFKEGRFGDPEDLRRITAFQKLNRPLENTLYSLGATRTEFYVHQYKPLLKFLDSERQRLLIADEVGLGKTIEAGLILVELRARRQLQEALIVCPASLVPKWRDEMQRRFDEEFDILSSSDFRTLLNRAYDRGDVGQLRAIISLQSLRQRGNRDLIEAMPIPLDLLIVDEAHHLRNPSTLSHKTIDALATRSSAILFLTATPIHLGRSDLFNLLQILDPGEFEDELTFQDRMRANEPVVEAERLLQRDPLPREEVLLRLKRMRQGIHSAFLGDDEYYERPRTLLEKDAALSVQDVIDLEQEIQDLNLLNHVITRSRKRDVFESVAVRSAVIRAPTPSPVEMEFYRLVTDFVRSQHDRADHHMVGVFAAITAQRQVASCMQAAKQHFAAQARADLADPESSDLELEMWDEELVEQDDSPRTLPGRLVDAANRLGDVDTKFDSLLDVLRELEAEEPGRKILIFAYFKATLRYLERRLTEAGFACTRIDGDVRSDPANPEKDERGARMRRFRRDPDLQILLSSEVGSEGLDFQFCHILVNYDLPWNPMRVEQRIGRLDRLGQEAERIIIINLSLPGTIEHKILRRLYQRIGIFERSIGDLEAILGEEIQQLTRDLLSRHLTPEEEDARISQAEKVLTRRSRELDRLESEGDRFIGRDAFFEDRLQRAREGGEVLAGEDSRTFFDQFLENRYRDAYLADDPDQGIYRLFVDERFERDIRVRRDPRPVAHRFLRKVTHSDAFVRVTFDSSAAFDDPDLEFLAPHHPAIQLAVEHYQENREQLHPTAAIRIPASEHIDPGHYFFFVFNVKMTTGRERHRLTPFLLDAESLDALPRHACSMVFGQMLREGAASTPPALPSDVAEGIFSRAHDGFTVRLDEDRSQRQARQQLLVNTRMAGLERSYERRLDQKRELLEKARRLNRKPRYIRLLEGTIRNLKADFADRREELRSEQELQMSSELVACGVLQVVEG